MNNNKIEPKFNEMQAYEELRMIFVIAIETQNFNGIEAKISAWEKKYPLADFTDPEIVRKIKTILNKEFLSRLLGDYLATKVLHEKEKQKQLYDDLKEIIESAKKDKDYKSAQKQIKKWKAKLSSEGLSLYSFDRFYRAKVCALLLMPSKELKNQDDALNSLKQIKDNSDKLSSENCSKAISDWQSKYSLNRFPEELKDELNSITTDILKSTSEKRNEETAICEVQEFVEKNSSFFPLDSIAIILEKYDYTHFSKPSKAHIEALAKQAMLVSAQLEKTLESYSDTSETNMLLKSKHSTTLPQFTALNDLKVILNHSPHNTAIILNWIYVNRKINFSQFARDEIIKQFTSVGYKIPSKKSYSIPTVNAHLNFSEIEQLKKDTIFNYLGIISQGNSLSKIGKDNISEVYSTSSLTSELSKPEITLPVFDTISLVSDNNAPVFKSGEEDVVYNIFSEELIADPLITVPFQEKFSPEPVEESQPQEILSPKAEEVEENVTISSQIKETEPKKILSSQVEKVEENVTVSLQIEENEPKKTLTPQVEEVEKNVTVSPHVEESQPQEILSPKVEEVEENFSTDEDLSYSLTLEDQKNVENIENEITYVAVAYPILREVFAYRQPVSRENKFQENSLQKNNGF